MHARRLRLQYMSGCSTVVCPIDGSCCVRVPACTCILWPVCDGIKSALDGRCDGIKQAGGHTPPHADAAPVLVTCIILAAVRVYVEGSDDTR